MSDKHLQINPLSKRATHIIKSGIVTTIVITLVIFISLFINFVSSLLSNCHLIELYFIISALAVILFPLEFLLHEVGHVLSLLIVYRLLGVDFVTSSKSVSIKCTSITKYKTVNKLPLHSHAHIRIFAAGGILFIYILSLIISFCFKFYPISIYWLCLELASLFNSRPTNDLNMFLHPERF